MPRLALKKKPATCAFAPVCSCPRRHCRRPRSHSNQTSRDTSFPLVILSSYNRRDDSICSGLGTLRSVWTTTHTEHTPRHTHTHRHTHLQSSPTLDSPLLLLSSAFKLCSASYEAACSFVSSTVWLYLSGVNCSGAWSAFFPRPCTVPSPLWFCWSPALRIKKGRLALNDSEHLMVPLRCWRRFSTRWELTVCLHFSVL